MEGTLTSGKKFASGTSQRSGIRQFIYADGSSPSQNYIQISNLGFTPSIILVVCSTYEYGGVTLWANTSELNNKYSTLCNYIGTCIQSDSYNGNNMLGKDYNIKPLSCVSGSLYQIPIGSSTSETYNWVAIE